MRRAAVVFGMVLAMTGLATAQTRPPSPPVATPSALNLPVVRERLPNGLRVVLSPDPAVPTAAVAVYYDVGSRVEPEGRTGFAHLFEHLMFEGTENLPKGEFDRLLTQRGADSNATTSEDRTNYFELLPASALELGLWLEADRMRALSITREAFENQRLTVMEERRQSYENQPYALSFLRLDEIFYEGYFPYAHSTIGDMRDLEMPGVSPEEQLARVRAFHARWYAPDNAVLVIAGDIEQERTMSLVRRHFGDIPARGSAPWQEPPFTPRSGERVASITDAHAEAPGFHLAWHAPPRRSADHHALDVLANVLVGGESSRIYRRLVREREVLADIEGGTAERRGPEMFRLWAVCAGDQRPEAARALVDAEIDRIVREGVTEREVQKSRNSIRAAFVFGLASPLHRAMELGESELYDGDAALLNRELEGFMAVTAADVQRVARRYLGRENRVVLDVLPAR